jgi:hypothetical protein
VTVDGEPTFLEAGQGVRVGDGRHPRLVAPRPGEFAALRFPGSSAFEGARLSPDRLVDPGFESGCGSEDEASGADGPAWRGTAGHVEVVGDAGRDGSRAIRIRARGSRAWPKVRQEVATGPLAGQWVIASVRARQPSDDLLRERQCAVLCVVFRDASGGEVAAAERRFLWADDPVDCYIPGRLVVRAPAEAVAIDFQVMLNAAGLATGTVLLDDARLSLARQGPR